MADRAKGHYGSSQTSAKGKTAPLSCIGRWSQRLYEGCRELIASKCNS
ncbi:hypothetical protein [Bartonella sp. AU55XJBT]|nr:hypothetical protein [Bartonella sp. AU55XJBT]